MDGVSANRHLAHKGRVAKLKSIQSGRSLHHRHRASNGSNFGSLHQPVPAWRLHRPGRRRLVNLMMIFATTVAALQPPLNPGTDRGVFVFGTLTLDFRERAEVYGRRSSLRNCSTEAVYCVDGEMFNIVLPRRCE